MGRLKPKFMVVGGFILILGLVLVAVFFVAGPFASFLWNTPFYGLNFLFFGTVGALIGTLILSYGLAANATLPNIIT
jgi:hypothetical protein